MYLAVVAALVYEYGVPYEEKYETLPFISHGDHGRMAILRFWRVNWLASDRFLGQFLRANIFRSPSRAEVQLGFLGRLGNLRGVNVMNAGQTGLVALTVPELMEFCLGYSSIKIAKGILSDLVHRQQQNAPYLGMANYVAGRQGPLLNLEAWVFDQYQQPGNWQLPAGWHGVAGGVPQGLGWENVRLLLVKIPSRHRSQTEYSVVIAYVPANRAVRHQDPTLHAGPSHHIKMWCCGPRTKGHCPVGARTVKPCTHVLAVLYAGCVLAHNPNMWHSTNHDSVVLHPGTTMPQQYSGDLLAGHIS